MTQPTIPMRVDLIGRDGRAIGHQDLGLPTDAVAEVIEDPDALSAFIGETLLPTVARNTLQAYLSVLPEAEREAALDRIGQVNLTFDPDGARAATWSLEMPPASDG